MKKFKVKYAVFVGVVLSVGILLSVCGSFSIGLKIYNYVYISDLFSLNYLVENCVIINDIVINLVDGFMENDQYGNYILFLVEDWSVFKDGLIYIYKLCKDVKWYIVDGEEYVFVIV